MLSNVVSHCDLMVLSKSVKWVSKKMWIRSRWDYIELGTVSSFYGTIQARYGVVRVRTCS